jgi:hypothetical protein
MEQFAKSISSLRGAQHAAIHDRRNGVPRCARNDDFIENTALQPVGWNLRRNAFSVDFL